MLLWVGCCFSDACLTFLLANLVFPSLFLELGLPEVLHQQSACDLPLAIESDPLAVQCPMSANKELRPVEQPDLAYILGNS